MRKLQLLLLSLLLPIVGIFAQEQLEHEKRVYKSEDGRLYIQKSLPVYLRLATSPEEEAESYLLKSEVTTKFSNPMYFDTEGYNTVRSPSAVDTTTHKAIYPLQDIIFEVYADGKAPVTKIKLNGTNTYTKDNIIVFGKGLIVDLQAFDAVSGVGKTFYSLNGEVYKEYSNNITITEEIEYLLKVYSVDHVGNVETPKEKNFFVDLKPPETSYEITGIKNEKFLSPKSKIVLKSSDEFSGVKHIYYSINERAFKQYYTPLSASILQTGDVIITYYAVDNVGNEEEKKVINTSSNIVLNKGENKYAFDFYIDGEGPSVELEIQGDLYKGKYQFISERSKIKINASDDKSGVDKVYYDINSKSLKNTYSEPFSPSQEKLQRIYFFGIDFVENKSILKNELLYLDKLAPKTKRILNGYSFNNRDTIFITDGTKMNLFATDLESGVQKILYKIDGSTMNTYDSSIVIKEEGFHEVSYQAKDHVNNLEEVKKIEFYVDNSAPEIFVHFSVEPIGYKTVREEKYIIYPSNSIMYIAATDNASGGEKILYKINGGGVQSILPVKGFKPGNYEIEVTAYDVLKNKSQKTIKFAIEK